MRVLIIPINYYRSSHEWQSYLSQQLCKTYWHMLINHLTYKITQNLYNDFTILILIVHCFFVALGNISTLAFTHCKSHSNSLVFKTSRTISKLAFAHYKGNSNSLVYETSETIPTLVFAHYESNLNSSNLTSYS
jgi:hypothetical protein